MSAFDVLLGSERVMWRFRHRALDVGLLIAIVIGGFVLSAILVRHDRPLVTVVNLDRGPIGQQLARAFLSSSTVQVSERSGSTAAEDLRTGAVDAYVFFPADFSEGALASHVLTPDIRVAAGSRIGADSVLQVFSQSLLSSAGTGGLRVQPRISYGLGETTTDPADYFMVGALAVAVYLFALFLPVLAIEDTAGKPVGTVLGSAVGCTLVALIVGLVLFMVYLGPLHFHNIGSVGLVVVIELLAAASAALIGVALAGGRFDAGRSTWVFALLTVTQLLLCGALFAINGQPTPVRVAANLLPLSDVVDGLRNVMLRRAGLDSSAVQRALASLLGYTLLLSGAISFLMKRREGRARGSV
ncbi:MAG: ABC transporter permease [Candidatus Dormibacter sp.]